MPQNADHSQAANPVIAGISVRLFSVVYDFLLIVALILVVGVIFVVLGTVLFNSAQTTADVFPAWYRYGLMLPSMLLVVFGFYAIFWRKTGQTLGMQTWRLQTVRADGRFLDWKQSFFRCAMACVLPILCGFVSYLFYHHPAMVTISFIFGFILNYLFAWTNPKHLALHDFLSGSVTLRLPAARFMPFWRKNKDKTKPSV